MSIIRERDIGGGVVRRRFTSKGESLPVGTPLSRDYLLSLPHANRQSLIDNGNIDIYPPGAASGERHAVSQGFKKWSVYEGKLLAKDLTKEEALALAAEGKQLERPN